jgi:hypothetical protein
MRLAIAPCGESRHAAFGLLQESRKWLSILLSGGCVLRQPTVFKTIINLLLLIGQERGEDENRGYTRCGRQG